MFELFTLITCNLRYNDIECYFLNSLIIINIIIIAFNGGWIKYFTILILSEKNVVIMSGKNSILNYSFILIQLDEGLLIMTNFRTIPLL